MSVADEGQGRDSVVPDSVPESDDVQGTQPTAEEIRMYDTFAEEYFDILDTLPNDLKRNFDLMREAEAHWMTARTSLHQLLSAYLHGDQREHKQLIAVYKASNDMIRASVDKASLANTMLGWVTRHALRLDKSITSLQEATLIGLKPGTFPSRMAPALTAPITRQQQKDKEKEGTQSQQPQKKRKALFSTGHSRKKARHERRDSEDESGPQDEEERYCYCNGIAWGEMVMCDNEDCPRQWYHYNCCAYDNSMDTDDRKWFCEDCRSLVASGVPIKIRQD